MRGQRRESRIRCLFSDFARLFQTNEWNRKPDTFPEAGPVAPHIVPVP